MTQAKNLTQVMESIRWHLSGPEIEAESFRTITEECPFSANMDDATWRVARRLIHTTADPSIAEGLCFRHNPVQAGLDAMANGNKIICDSKMIRAGISIDKLRRINANYTPEHLVCAISDDDVIARAKAEGRTRAMCAAEKVRPDLDGAIILVGNAPLSLARFARYILEENAKPALIIGMPVGFVNVVESKELLAFCDVPHIVLEGRRGGSALAVCTLHAIMEKALG